jgi:hypothetical protein
MKADLIAVTTGQHGKGPITSLCLAGWALAPSPGRQAGRQADWLGGWVGGSGRRGAWCIVCVRRCEAEVLSSSQPVSQ